MPDFCEDYMDFYHAWIHFIELTHKYMHDPDLNLPHRPTKATSIEQVIALAEQQKAIIGAEATEEIIKSARELQIISRRVLLP